MIQAKQQQLHRLQQERNSLHFGLNPEVDAEIAVLDGRIFLLEGEIAAERLFADSTAAAVFREIQVLQWLEDVLRTTPPPLVVDKPISIGEMKEEDYAFSNEDHEKLLAALKAYYMAKQPDYLPDDVKEEAIADDMKVMEGYTSEQLYDRLHDLMSNDEEAEYYEKLVQQKGFDAKQQWHNDPGYQGFVKVQLAQNESPGGSVLEGGMFFAATVLKLFSPKYAPDTGKPAGGGETDNQNLPNGARTKQEDEGEGSKEVGETEEPATKTFVEDPFDEEGNLKPNVKYKAGEYQYDYETDHLGRIEKFSADDLKLTTRDERLPHHTNTPGKEPGDHAGHLAGDRFGGSPELDNLVSQSSSVNLSQYKKIENQWANALKEGKTVKVNVEVKYEGDSLRPSEFNIQYEIDGKYVEETLLN